MEAGTSVIESGNTIMSRSLLKGADMNQVGNKVAEISSKLNELQIKRMQTSRTFETIIIVLHGLTIGNLWPDEYTNRGISYTIINSTSIKPGILHSVQLIQILST